METGSASVITALAASPDMVEISQNALVDMEGVGVGEIAERHGVRYIAALTAAGLPGGG